MARPGQIGGKRDYAAEYRARIERLQAEGYSRSQARGHSRKGERSIRVERVRERVEEDRRAAFGDLPRRQRGESNHHYEQRLEDTREEFEEGPDYDPEYETEYDFEDKEKFLDRMREEGLSEHEAHDLWFGY